MLSGIKFYFKIAGITSLLCAIKAKLTNSLVMLRVKRRNIRFPFYLRIPSSDILVFNQIFINHHYDFLVKKEPKIIVDAGAHIGLASIYFANKYPTTKIIAIEPEKNNFELLKKNTSSYSNIYPVNAALWNKNTEINMIDPQEGTWGFIAEEQASSNNLSANVSHTVKAVTIGKIINDYQLDKIDILKIDIEGSEKEVFSDTSFWIEKINSIIIELHDFKKPGCLDSFRNGTKGFDSEWKQDENLYLSKGEYLIKHFT